ncbi:MAG: gamma-glutamyl-gamma-aminobutyrate hydrolase family protein [Oscillospiraceae bacterium]|nr:gamma-glutamyl-gamma-aminobutyrate hydrolase family protein [Oscillospiraceae bacterium]
MRPLIGISCSMGQAIYSMTQDNPPQLQHRMNDSYVKAIVRAGGIPVILPNNTDVSCVEEIAERLDGFLLSGGDDVDPVLFGQRATAKLGHVIPQRDNFEIALTRQVLEKTKKPLLGICRGIQVMNVAMGGSLHIDLPDAGKLCHSLNMYPRNGYSHSVEVLADSRLATMMGSRGQVNSFHHQAIDEVAPGLLVTARSVPDEVVEAVELPGERFVVGVQWHPEELVDAPEAVQLFRSFVEAAEK